MTQPTESFLAHYGVRGMKWGVRKRRDKASSGPPEDVIIKTRPGKRIETAGGRNQPASDDAKKAYAYKQKAKASSVHSLSNQELQALITRMNLEQQYSKVAAADAAQRGKGRKFLEDLLKSEVEAKLKGKPGTVGPIVSMIKAVHKGRKTKAAATAGGAAARVATKALTGVVVNR